LTKTSKWASPGLRVARPPLQRPGLWRAQFAEKEVHWKNGAGMDRNGRRENRSNASGESSFRVRRALGRFFRAQNFHISSSERNDWTHRQRAERRIGGRKCDIAKVSGPPE